MRFTLAILMLGIMSSFAVSLYAQDRQSLPDLLDPPKKSSPEPVPYSQDYFPQWAYYSYRFLAITIGSFPFSILFSTVAFDTYRTVDFSVQSSSFESKYLPLFFGGAEKPTYTSDEVLTVLYIGLGFSLSFAIIDLIISLATNSYKNSVQELFEGAW